ncbi:MAG: efflux RND transporter periplasmic adaptor subunit [Gemmatimonadetes bacterium]|nr:efflux RND transporter periplasmic adaptor subunit [Gemmatimonadota bacterium]
MTWSHRYATLLMLALACRATPSQDPESEKVTVAVSPSQDTDMGMEMSDGGPLEITASQAQLAGVTIAIATRAATERTIRAFAEVVPDERLLGEVNARVDGWVERLLLNETGRLVQAGEPLFEIYAPAVVAAQEELLLAKRLGPGSGNDSLVVAARRRLRLWNIDSSTVAAIEASGRPRRRLPILSPYTGHVLEKSVIEGQMVHPGDRLFLIADLSTVWVEPAIFERDLQFVAVGQRAEVRLDAFPGEVFHGRVTFMQPVLDRHTRAVRMRIEIPNPDYRLKPMMYATVTLRARGVTGVTVPLTAVLPTGEQNLAFVFRDGGIVPTPVEVGSRGDSTLTILSGVAVGDTLIASATFLFDSESSLAAAMQGLMLNMGMGLDMGGMDMGEMDMEGESKMGDMVMPDTATGGGRP